MAVTVLTTLAGVASLVTHRCGVLTVQGTVMASWATTISVVRAVILSTVEAVVMLSITNLIISITLCVCQTNVELADSIIVTEVFCMAVTVIIALAGVASQVTHRSRVLTVQSTVMASWTAAICIGRTIILSTIEAVVILSIANLVKPITFCVCQANCNLTYATSITEVFWMTVTVIITLAGVVSKITDRGRVLTV